MATETLELVTYITYRLLLPLVLAVAACIRISGISLLWLLFFMGVPCLPQFSYRNWIVHKSLKVYIILLQITSTLACCGHIVFWALQLSHKLDISVLTLCDPMNMILMNIGFQSLHKDVVPCVLDRVRLMLPDFIVFLTATVTTILCFKSPITLPHQRTKTGLNLSRLWRTIEPFVTTICLFLAGAVAPSIVNGIYFAMFITLSTLWAMGVKFGKIPHIKLMLLFVTGVQMITLYIYQFQIVYSRLPSTSLTARLLGFVQYYNLDCAVNSTSVPPVILHNPLHLEFTENLEWGNYVFVFTLTALYFSLGLSARFLIKISGSAPRNAMDSEESRNLLHADKRTSQTYNTINIDGVLEDAARLRGSIRSRHSSFASSYHPEEEGTFNQILRVLVKLLIDQVYLLTLLILMLWSIAYISWMEFVLLVLVCFLCICPKAKEASYSVAYPLVGYGTILVSIQYIYGLDLTEEELPQKMDIGLKREKSRGAPVFIKALFLSVFWIHLRAYLYQQVHLVEGAGSSLRHNRYTVKIYEFYRNVRHVILTYWPVVCYATLTTASLHSHSINIMRIIYLCFFAAFMFCYVISRKPLELCNLWLWYLLITYSMICVILLYTYQLPQISSLWTDDKDTIADIGMSKSTSPTELFLQLLIPILVLLTVTIQLRVFRAPPTSDQVDDPMLVADPMMIPEPVEQLETEENPAERKREYERRRARLKSQTYMTNLAINVADTMKEFWSESKTFASRAFHISLAILEMHSPKFVSLAIFYVCVWRVSVINVVLLLITVCTLPWPLVQYKLTIPIFCWVCWEIFTQLIYQLYMVQTIFTKYLDKFIEIPCSGPKPFQCHYKDKSDIEWLGYYVMNGKDRTLSLDNSPWAMVWGYVVVIVLLVIQRLLVHYTKGRRSPHVYILREGVFPDFIFPNITRASAETKISLQLMYLCNNCFVLFGKEVVYILHVVVAAVRYDLYGLLYIILLGIWKNLHSRTKVKMCMPYIILINILIAVQYILLIGLPPGLCFQYPWCGLQEQKLSLLIWLNIPSTPSTSNQFFILADFLLLLSVTRLWHTFQLQKLDPTLAGALDPSPGPDYADPSNKSLLNNIKLFIFTYLWWVTAAVLFLNAVMTISVFSVGFLLATFSLLWFGSSLLTRSTEKLLKVWEMVAILSYIVVLVKVILQLPSCVTFQAIEGKEDLKDLLCPVADFLKLICLQHRPKGYEDNPFSDCPTTANFRKSTFFLMDALTFMFVMVQIRVFKSPYFGHARNYLTVLIETSAQGAMIMKHRVTLRTKINFDAEEEHLKDIREHVAVLKAQHDSQQDFDFGTKELVAEALQYWEERERREAEAVQLKSQLYLTQEIRTSEISDYELRASDEEEFAEPSAPGATASAPSPSGDFIDTEDVILEDGEPDDIEYVRDIGEVPDIAVNDYPVWTPKPPKADKPTEEIIVDVIEFSHQSFVSFIEFTVAWLDDKSGDYRYTSNAIFKERYNALKDPGSLPTLSSSSYKFEDVLEDVGPSSSPTDHIVIRLATAFYFFCLARTELLCFLFMVVNHVMNASIISFFYPLMAFLWGMIAFPRPSGIFWYIVIVYCKISIVVKYIFHFDSIHWNSAKEHYPDSQSPMWLPNLLGLTKTEDLILITVWDLLVLMSVFFHKSCLETAGIWSLWYDTFDDLEHEEREQIVSLPSTAAGAMKVTGVTDDSSDKETTLIDKNDSEESFGSGQHSDSSNYTTLAKLNFIMFWKLLIEKAKKDMPKDLYLPMLLSSLLALIVTVLGWNSFGKVQTNDKVDVTELISTNYIPSVFLIILLAQFMMMIFDRIIYLKKSMIAKYMYQVFVFLVIHIYLFLFQPWFTKEYFKRQSAWIAMYVFFCCYFTLSAFQIQSGYPRIYTDSIILRTYGLVTYVTYLGYLAVPFLWELEVLLNWVCTETTLTLDYWVKYSDIKAYLFKLKCWQTTYESSYYLGEKQPTYMRYGIGGLLVLLLILIIWFPLLFMSVVTTNSVPNPPTAFFCSLSITGLEPLVNIKVAQMPPGITDNDFAALKLKVSEDGSATLNNSSKYSNYTEFLGRFKTTDVVKLDILSDSTTLWEISPAAVKYLVLSLEDPTYDMTMRFEWSLVRNPDSVSVTKVATGYTEINILDKPDPDAKLVPYVSRTALLDVIQNCDTTHKLMVDGLIPSFLLAKETGTSTMVQLFPPSSKSNSHNVKDVEVSLSHDKDEPAAVCRLWDGFYWSFNQTSEMTTTFTNPFGGILANRVQFYIFSDRIVSSQYQLIASYGIIGLYISVVLVIFKFVRLTLADTSTRIIFQEMPCPDLIMDLVKSTEMVRAQSEFVLEQVLFRKLLLLYRSPETLIVWTGRHRHLKEE
uniref:Piezo mechanosensor n=1 Tax=Beroe abyssicola TaxID=320166 RepID=A0A1S6WN70_BERAB|nr:piezo mechanosensor [Beroe abyssicola]